MPCDLALLDVNLPGESGFEIANKLRETSDVPIIFLTARDSAEDELIGFRVGADDYIHKPYNSTILLARIDWLLARKLNNTKVVRELTLNLVNLSVHYHGKSVTLTKNESRILASLMKKVLNNSILSMTIVSTTLPIYFIYFFITFTITKKYVISS
ncbi:response regulator transcription factor [Kurthia senegalensis]|uniref:response regulator transcription factor n=1 Tax=Kurthia senegalensis TaxID=1033740 RepID=UPI000289A7DE|nr:response regulator transcription factor [Kurthia senegalensis]